MDKNGFSNFLLGLGVGVGIGMLFAPKSGSETREMLMSKADEGKEYLKQRTSDMRGTADDLIQKGKDMVNRQKDNLQDAMEAGKQAYRDTLSQRGEA